MTISPDTMLTRAEDILFAQVGSDEGVILSVEQGAYFALNPVASRICALLDTPTTVAEISARLSREFVVDPATADAEILTFVHTLVANGIVRADQ